MQHQAGQGPGAQDRIPEEGLTAWPGATNVNPVLSSEVQTRAMSGFALPKMRWLLLGALAAGGWAMTQEAPSKFKFDERPARSASRPKAEVAPRKEATVARPKPAQTAKPGVEVVRPKVDVEATKTAKAQQPKPAVTIPKPVAATKATPRQDSASGPRKPAADLATASISRPPTPLPRPAAATGNTALKETAPKPQSHSAPSLNVLYTSTTVYLRKRPNVTAPVIYSLKQGEMVRVFARDGKWALVSTPAGKGWLHDEMLLRPADPAAPRPREVLAEPAKSATPG